jgi:hypothetical protein
MVNRTGTYFAFDGLGETDPTKSDFRYYATVQSWNAAEDIDFKFVNSHDKASAVRDASKVETLKASIRKRLAASKNIVVIISPDTRKSGSMLSYEIEKAVDLYKIPLIIAYTAYGSILNVKSHADEWPTILKSRLDDATANAIHLPFKKDAIFTAINQFTVNSGNLNGPYNFYSREAQVKWGYISGG